jgi:hypothetical protein
LVVERDDCSVGQKAVPWVETTVARRGMTWVDQRAGNSAAQSERRKVVHWERQTAA